MRRTLASLTYRVRETRPPSSSKKGFHSPRCPSLFLPTLFLSSSPPCFIYPLSFARSRSRYEESSFGVTRFVGREIQFYTTRCNRSNYGIKHRAVFSFLPMRFFSNNARICHRRNQAFREREAWKFFLTSIDRMRVVYGQTVIFYNRRI